MNVWEKLSVEGRKYIDLWWWCPPGRGTTWLGQELEEDLPCLVLSSVSLLFGFGSVWEQHAC